MSAPSSPNLPSPIVSNGVVPYHLLNERPKEFERLIRRLMEDDPSLKNVKLYGLSGQKQFGIDLRADHVANANRDVASAKCVEEASTSSLKTWSTDFLKHQTAKWPNVTRFVLATAAQNIIDTKLIDQCDAEARKFAQVGIDYEVWGPDQLTARIQKAGRPVAVHFLGEDWARTLFGPDAQAQLSAAQIDQVAGLMGLVSGHLTARLTRAMQQLRAGDYDEVRQLLAEVRTPAQWSQLRPATQAHALRLAAGLSMLLGDLATATTQANEALALDPSVRRTVAVIELRTKSPAAALTALGQIDSRLDRQLRAAILLDGEQAPEASNELDILVAEDPDDWETQRLLSRLRSMEGRRVEAREAAERAYAMAPRDIQTIRALGMTRYAEGLSPMAPLILGLLPVPGDPDLVRTDDKSRVIMESALVLFEQLAGRTRPEWVDRVWRLACLANTPGRQADASTACRELLAADPGDALVINWGFARALDFDRAGTEMLLAGLYAKGQATADQVRVYGMMVATRAGLEAANAALATHLGAQNGEAEEAAKSWVEAGEPPSMDPNVPSPAAVNRVLEEAGQSGDWTPIETYLQTLLGGDKPHAIGLELASAVAEQRRWRSIAPFADALTRFETARATRLAIYAVHHAGTAQALLDLSEQRRVDFPNAQLPLDCRRMVMMATERLGDLPGALTLAEQIVAETGNTADRLFLADIHIQAGNIQAALTAIRQGLEAKVLPPDRALRYSLAVTREDPPLAQALWRAAIAGGVPDSLLLHALSQGYKLGLNTEAETLMPRVHQRALSGAGDVWLVDVDDVVQEMVARRDRSQDLGELLAAGAMPIHLVARALNISLANLYALAPRAKERGALAPLFLRHGARPSEAAPDVPWTRWQLHLDITSLLLLDQLDLWSHLDALETPVRVSRSLMDAILKLELDASHHQISQVRIAQAILDAHRDRRLAVQSVPASEAETVRHERLAGSEAGAGPTVRAVRAGLGRPVPASDGDLDQAPAARGRLLFIENTLETVAMDDLLDAALEGFACEVPQPVIDCAAETVRAAAARETLADGIDELKKKVALRLESGKLVRLAPRPAENAAVEDDEDLDGDSEAPAEDPPARTPDFIEQGLMDLLAAPGAVNAMLWIDDRHITGYPLAETKTIVGILEVLDALRAADRLTDDEHRMKLLQLRAAGAVFLPIRAAEVLAPLKAADVKDGDLIETEALVILRRNLAVAMRLDGKLKIGPSDIPNLEGRPDEVPFMLESRRIVHECLIELWAEADATVDQLRARSEWLWSALRLEQPVRMLPGGENSGTLLAALNIASLLSAAPNIGSSAWDQALPRRQAFVAWLTETAIAPRASEDDTEASAFFDLVTTHLATLATESDRTEAVGDLDVSPDEAKRLFGLFRRRLFDLMPDTIQERLLNHPDFLAETGVGGISIVNFGDVAFPAEPLWAAVTSALRDGSAEVESHEGAMLSLTRTDKGGLVLTGALDLRIREPWFPVLAADGNERPMLVEAYLKGRDLPPGEFDRLLATGLDALAAKSDSALVEAMQEARGGSVIDHYAQLSDAIGSGAIKSLDPFRPPPAAALVHHLRLGDLERTVADQAPEAWRELSETIGAAKALRRLGGLPVPFAAATEMSTDEQSPPPPFSPTSSLHLAAAARRTADETGATQIMRDLVAGMGTSGKLFNVLLHWAARAYANDEAWRGLPTGHQLALVWSHAHRAMTLALERGANVDQVTEYFERNPAPQDMLVGLWRSSGLEADCAAPDQMLASGLVFAGLGYVYGEEDISKISSELAAEVPSALFAQEGSASILQAGLILWNPEAANTMGSFLTLTPVGTLLEGIDPRRERRKQLKLAMSRLEDQPTDVLHWAALNRLGDTGLPTDLADRLRAVFDAVKLEEINAGDAPIQGPAVAIDTRLALPGDPIDDLLNNKIYQLARHFSETLRGPFGYQDRDYQALSVLVEAAARAAMGPDVKVNLDRLGALILVIADGWPAAAAPLRAICDSYARSSSPETGTALWRALVALRAWP